MRNNLYYNGSGYRDPTAGQAIKEAENKNVEPKMVTYAKEIYARKNKGNFNNFIYGKVHRNGK